MKVKTCNRWPSGSVSCRVPEKFIRNSRKSWYWSRTDVLHSDHRYHVRTQTRISHSWTRLEKRHVTYNSRVPAPDKEIARFVRCTYLVLAVDVTLDVVCLVMKSVPRHRCTKSSGAMVDIGKRCGLSRALWLMVLGSISRPGEISHQLVVSEFHQMVVSELVQDSSEK